MRVDIEENRAALDAQAPRVVRDQLVELGDRIVASMVAGHLYRNESGHLTRSLHFTLTEEDTLRVGSSAYYARFVEEGTSEKEPRPFLLPALLENADHD